MAQIENNGIAFSGCWYGPKLFTQRVITTGSPYVAWYEYARRSAPALLAAYGLFGFSGESSRDGRLPLSPYTSSVDTWRKRSTFAFRAASSMTWVPSTSVRTKSPASRTDRSTWVSAAKWTTASAPRMAAVTIPASHTSPRSNEIVPASRRSRRFARFPAYVSLSRTTTSWPFLTAIRTKFDPMNPAPPVTRRRTARDNRGAYIRARSVRPPGTPNSLRVRAIRTALQDVLVIGGSGLLGQHLVREASTRGYRAHGTFSSEPVSHLIPLDVKDLRAIRDILSPLR